MIIMLIFAMATITACDSKDTNKEDLTATSVNKEKNQLIIDVHKLLQTGNTYLYDQKNDKAKEAYDKAITLDKNNKDIYLKIKDTYVSLKMEKEATDIINKAIENKVDIENMKKVLTEIKDCSVVTYKRTIYKGQNFKLPENVKELFPDGADQMTASDNTNLVWEKNEVIGTNNIGEFT